MRFLFTALSLLVHVLFLPITGVLGVGLLAGAWFLGRQLRPPRRCDADGELGANEWLGHARAEWLGA